jgi:hypothetical protein
MIVKEAAMLSALFFLSWPVHIHSTPFASVPASFTAHDADSATSTAN